MNLINELRMLAEDLYSAGGHSRYAAALSKAADEIESLERYHTAYNEWIDKTEWMQKGLPAKYLGMHRANALKDLISELFDRLEAAEKDIALKEKIIDALGSALNAVANERDTLHTALEKIADWDSAWGPYPETNEAWRAMAIVTAREAVPRPGEKK